MAHRYTRRSVLTRLGATAALAVLPASALRASADTFRSDPFTLGVASGYPTHDTVVLWTRIAPEPFAPGGGISADAVVPVQWQIASDEKMTRVVRQGTYYAAAQWAHSVHAEIGGLDPDREYWYRFTAGGVQSPTGRTRTAPRGDAVNSRLRIAVASCQQYEHGYYLAYRHMLQDQLDLIVHVGDYMYENSGGNDRVRRYDVPEAVTLDDYRIRYALYRSDQDLQRAHAACPWLVTWDDHEVENDYAGSTSQGDDPVDWFLARRAAAYRAYYEHMPLPRRAAPLGAHMRLHAQRSFGQLVDIFMLDSRQYRVPLACTEPGRRTSRSTNCPQLHEGPRSKLGEAQEGWLARQIQSSRARWNLFAQGTVMAYMDEEPGPGQLFWNDGWNGYPAARQRLFDAMARSSVSNPVVLSGDIHAFLVSDLHRTAHDPGSPVIGAELVTTSISSRGLPQHVLDSRRRGNPHVRFANSERRGYLRLDITNERLQADLVAMSSVTERDAARFVQASFAVESGRPGVTA